MPGPRHLLRRSREILRDEGPVELANAAQRFLKFRALTLFQGYEITRGIYYRTFDPERYWERRYSSGGDSGPGSAGEHAQFKAAFVNEFVERHDVETVVEFGCGDGAQVGLGEYPEYVGLEISRSAIERCAERFGDDPSKSFFLYSPRHFVNHGALQADLTLSLEVLFHIPDDDEYEAYMHDLFSTADRYVVVFASDHDEPTSTLHMRHRRFTDDVEAWFPEFELRTVRENEFPERHSDFYVYERTG